MSANATVELEWLLAGACRVEWWDPQNGKSLGTERVTVDGGVLRLAPPAFVRDVAATIGAP